VRIAGRAKGATVEHRREDGAFSLSFRLPERLVASRGLIWKNVEQFRPRNDVAGFPLRRAR